MTSHEITDAAVPTDDDFRAIGFTKEARNWPRDELAVKLIAAFNGVPADDLPSLAWRYFPNKQTAEAWKRVADAALAAGRAEAVAVKPLEWREEVAGMWWTAENYRIEACDGGGFAARVTAPSSRNFHTLVFGVSFEAAKAAAQADYEARVLSALEPASSALVAEPGEPVAWEQRHRENSGEWSKWYPTSKKAFDLIGTESDGSLQARPLYAAPPARQDGALREAAAELRRIAHRYLAQFSGVQRDVYAVADRIDAALAQSAAPVQQAAPSGEGE